MYILIPKQEDKKHNLICIAEKTALARKIGLHRHTITNRFKKSNNNYIETDDYIIYKAIEYIPRTKKTGFTSYLRQQKR